MRYRIEYTGPGFTAWQGFTIKNVEKYEDKDNIPKFNTDDSPITEGLRLLEKSGKIKIVDLDMPVEEPDAPVETADEEQPADEEVEEAAEVEGSVEVNEPELTEIKTFEFDGKEIELVAEVMDEELTSNELDDVCKENDISGYSSLNKGEKINLIIESL